MPHPTSVCEIAADHVSVARWSGSGGSLEAGASEPLEAGVLKPSPVDTNLVNAEGLTSALRRVFDRAGVKDHEIALLVPDPVVRVFIFPFETLPRRADEAIPLLRWRLKKSVPFDVEETVISSMRQPGRDSALEIITAVARRPIIREYETAVEAVGAIPGVVLSSTMACLPLLDESGATMFVRMGGRNLTSVIVRGSNLCVYRSAEMAKDPGDLEFHVILDEIYPAVAYYQDTWGGELDRVLLAGFADKEETIRLALANELKTNALPLADVAPLLHLSADARTMLTQGQEALVGWMANGA